MRDLIRFNWQAFDPVSGTKVTIGVIVMMTLMKLTGETWMATGLVVLLAWLTNVPGTLKDRISGMLMFAVGVIAITLISGWIGLNLWLNLIVVTVVGLLGTLALALGMRAFMVGYSVICWAIYVPFLVDSTSVANCILAIICGTGVLMVIYLAAAVFKGGGFALETTENSSTKLRTDFIVSYSITLAAVLALTTYLGWALLKTDPTLIAGGAFFIIGFDANKTWIAGLGRVIGVVTGTLIGVVISKLLFPGLFLDLIMIVACFLSFATIAVHSSFFMFFLMIFLSISWQELDPVKLNLTFWERLTGETAGVLIAIAAIVFLQWLQNRRLQ